MHNSIDTQTDIEQLAQQLLDSPTAILLMGPTASGKTALAQALCDILPCQIINVDSAQFYRYMNIGSAKPDAKTLLSYPHRMIDFLDPGDNYSVAQFQQEVLVQIQQVIDEGAVPLLVGGSMLYFKVLVEGINELPSTEQALRQRLIRIQKYKGLDYIYRWLEKVDFDTAQRLHPNDSQRILRALEVYLLCGEKLSSLQQSPAEIPLQDFNWLPIVLFPENRKWLHNRIAMRFDAMLDQGLLKEVEGLYKRQDLDLNENSALRAVGYRQVWEYLDGMCSYEQMRERGIIATRQFAKRQYTWLRSWLKRHAQSIVLDNSARLNADSEAHQPMADLCKSVVIKLSNLIK